ncbi:PEP-CTERM sorting domain-containing protein [Poriferisphaera sp. WC338]|uniref:PEP-CTERM sorting domain-containing protein n=1 Tax=Poriferisphaera sp. WC338 TaxID=3425129 RepID=UPI003D815881
MKTIKTIAVMSFISLVIVTSAQAALTFENYGYLAPQDGNNVRIDVATINGVEQFVYTSGRSIHITGTNSQDDGVIEQHEWTQIGGIFSKGDPSFMVVNPYNTSEAFWGQGGSFNTARPLNLVSGLDTAAVTFSADFAATENVYAGDWRSSDEMYLVAKSKNVDDSYTNKLIRIYDDNGSWASQDVVEFTNDGLFSGGMTVSDAGDVYLTNSSGNIFKFTAAELGQAITSDTAITLAGDDNTDAHFLTNLGTSGSLAIAGGKLFASGFELSNTLKSFDLTTSAIESHVINDVAANNYGYQLVGNGDDIFALRNDVNWSTFTIGNSILWGATVPEPASLILLGAAGLLLTRRKAS